MKKFYSFVAIVAVALASVFVCASCSKDESGDEPGKETQEENSVWDYAVVADEAVQSVGDIVITVEKNGQSKTYKLSEGEVLTATDDNTKKTMTGKAIVIKDLTKDCKLTHAFLPNEEGIAQVTALSCKIGTVYTKHLTSGINAKTDVFVMDGLMQDKIADYLKKRMAAFDTTFENKVNK